MKLRRPRDGDVLENGDIVLIRGDLDLDILCAAPPAGGGGRFWRRPPAGHVGKVAVARTAPVVVTRRAPVSGPFVTGSGLPQYP
jgi:hypothetical protein